MPSTIIPPGFAQCFLRWRLTGDNEEMLSSIGVRLQAGISDPNQIAGNIITHWQSAWAASTLGSAWVLVGARAYVGSDGDYPVGEFVVNTAGTSATAKLPNNCALLARKRTALGGRRNRGRMFIPSGYLSEGSVTETGDLTVGDTATFSGRMQAFLDAIEAEPVVMDAGVILHSSTPTTPTVITSMDVSGKIATQRTRMRR